MVCARIQAGDQKRTPLIRDREIDTTGVVRPGDGAWGVDMREVHSLDDTWYLERGDSVMHFILETSTEDNVSSEMIDREGGVFDEFFLAPMRCVGAHSRTVLRPLLGYAN